MQAVSSWGPAGDYTTYIQADELYVGSPTKLRRRLCASRGVPACETNTRHPHWVRPDICMGLGKDGKPLRVMVTITPGDRHILVYEGDTT